jgi:hypothetical protein
METDTELLNWLELQAKKSRIGISIDWVPSVDGDPSGFRFMKRFHIGEPEKTLCNAIEQEMRCDNAGV